MSTAAAASTETAPAGEICAVCDRPIRAGGVKFIRHSGSGARPSSWAHDIRDPSCQRPRAAAQ